mgnify:CR=1 FL=1
MIVPIASPSRSIGTDRTLRNSALSGGVLVSVLGSSRTSGMWTMLRVRIARCVVPPRLGGHGYGAAKGRGAFGSQVLESGQVDELAVEPEDGAEPAVTQAQRIGRDGIEHRLGIGPRAADDAQDLARGRLLLQCFRQALLELPTL